MEDLNLTETEMRYFGDLFLCCDEESNGKIPILKATELFRSSNVPNDVLKQIMDISVAPHICASLNHMNRKQFYSSLKLIAAHQQNMALKPELLSKALDLPLPRFTWALNSEASPDLIQLSNSPKEQHIKRDRNFVSLGTYEPIRISSNLSDSDVPQTLSHDATEGVSTDSEIESETMSQRSDNSRGRRGKNGSPWSTASESPTPTNSVAERPHPVWEHSATGRGVWPTNTGEEHTQLLGTEEESSDRHSSDEETEGVSRGGAGSAGGPGGAGGWAVSDAQARHYAAQFAQLRPDRGLLAGHTARLFFEKSRLPVADLRKIWQLADVTKDGALSLEEFSIAMHLIVLRRNNVPVPDTLPAALAPRPDRARAAPGTDLLDLGPAMLGSGSSADFNLEPPSSPPAAAAPSPPTKPEPLKEWTKFVDSPTSSVSSPGPKPVNFDFQKVAVERDPKIFHPVALRVTPDGDERASPKRDGELKPLQRPQPKKPLKPGGVLPPPPARDDGPGSLGRAQPPPPPPRPRSHHARSSSLDLTRLKSAPPPPPLPPPRTSPAPAPAFAPPPPDYEAEGMSDEGPKMHGAFEVYRKPLGAAAAGAGGEGALRPLQEQNAALQRVCRALLAELADTQQEKETLRAQLDPAL